MSAKYPAELYAPRTVANRDGVSFDAEKTKVLFAEDHNRATVEIVAIESELGLNAKGVYASVKEWLTAITSAISALPAVPVKATGSELIAGTDDTKFATALGLQSVLATGWVSSSASWAYASADAPTFTITVPSGAASLYGVGMKIKLTQTTVKYFIITNVTNTVLTVYGGTDYTLANAAISAISYSSQKAPLGFPLSPNKWTVEVTDNVARLQNSPTASQWYNLGGSIEVPIGSWRPSFQVIQTNQTANKSIRTTLSNASNSELTVMNSCGNYYPPVGSCQSYVNRVLQIITLTTKATYYLNAMTLSASSGALYFYNNESPSIIRFECAYL